MANVVSIPSKLHTALRSVEYTFNVPDIGTAPEKNILRYRLKNETDNVYLTDWKYYEPVSNAQQIKIDFYKDLFGIVATSPPDLKFPNQMQVRNDVIKKITVEYGERQINTETCDPPTDLFDGTTQSIDVLNGITRFYQVSMPENDPFYILSNRPKKYKLNKGCYDWLYVIGAVTIQVEYYTEQIGLGTVSFTATGIHAGSPVTIIPIGFQYANTLASYIIVKSPQAITVDNPTGQLYFITSGLCGCENGEAIDIYFQNAKGGVDAMSFDCVDVRQMNIAKQYHKSKFNKQASNFRTAGQRRVVNNASEPVIYLKRQFPDLEYIDSRWLDECASASNIWMRDFLDDETEVLIRMNVQDGSAVTYTSGGDVELTLALTYSEEILYPY